MTLAAVRFLPGLGDGPSERPATYVEYLRSVGLSARTITAYWQNIRRMEAQAAGMGFELVTANANALAALASAIPNSHARRGQMRCALKHFYEWQDRMNAPLRAVRVPPNPVMVCRALEPDQASRLVEAARGWWPHGGAVFLGLYLALRREEIARAQWERFDEGLEWYTVTGKFDKTATIPVPAALRDELAPRRSTGYLFPGRKNMGPHVNPATVWSWVKLVASSAGIEERFTTHFLRHTALTTALDATDNLRGVMAFARHNKPETTAGYTRTTAQQLRTVADAIRY